ncbi:MAG: LytTR family DNA-binding domain-containing protein [Myxococcota bacterium]
MSYRVLVLDDEPLARRTLSDLLAGMDDVAQVDTVASLAEAGAWLSEATPDVLFLDVELARGTSFELLEHVDPHSEVVFLTAHTHYAHRAFAVDAVDYLLKPVTAAAVERALTRVSRRRPLGDGSPPLRPLTMEDRVRLQETKRVTLCRVADITHITGAGNYAEVHLARGRTALVKRRLRSWEAALPDAFVRIGRSTLVNLERAGEITLRDGVWHVHLEGVEAPLPVSRRCATSLQSSIGALFR